MKNFKLLTLVLFFSFISFSIFAQRTDGVYLIEGLTSTQIEALTDQRQGLLFSASDNDDYYGVDKNGIPKIIGHSSVFAYGLMHVTTPIETSIATVDTPVKIAGTTSFEGELFDDNGTSNRLRFIGLEPRFFEIVAAISVTSAGNNQVYSFYLAKNGVVIEGSKQQRKVSTGADVGSIAIVWNGECAENDYLEVWVENNTGTTNLTADYLVLTAN